MSDLHACYFCGEVGDGLARRVVVPRELTDDDGVTAVLCPRCDRKLTRIVDPILEAAGDAGTELDAGDPDSVGIEPAAVESSDSDSEGAESSGFRPAEVESGASGATDAGSTGADSTGAGPADSGSADEPTEVVSVDPDATDSEADESGSGADASEPQSGAESAVDGPADAAAERDPTAVYETIEDEIIVAGETIDDGAAQTGRDGETGEGVTLDRDASETARSDDPTDVTLGRKNRELSEDRGAGEAGRGAAEVDVESDETGGTDGAGGGADPMETVTVKPAAFRKVMRLLSNREFPVDRAEFESLAANAYDLDGRDVAAMLDAAVDQGVIGERSGKLVRD